MYKLLLIVFLLASCATARIAKPVRLVVTHVERHGSSAEVYARRGYELYFARCITLPDSIRAGSVLLADWYKGQYCTCLFKRIK